MTPNPYSQYRTTQITTASAGDLVVLLYDAAVQALMLAEDALDAHAWSESTRQLVQAQKLVMELNNGVDLNRGGDLAVKLRSLYLYMYRTLVQASIDKNASEVRRIRNLLNQLRASWRAVVKGEPVLQPAGVAA